MIKMFSAVQVSDYLSPFDQTVDGFDDGWWERAGSLRRSQEERFSFFEGDSEVARAEVAHDWQFDALAYEKTPVNPRSPYVTFFEVRSDLYRAGVGRAAMALLVDHYKGSDLIAYSLNADWFWQAIGWRLIRRIDGYKFSSPLYVHLRDDA
ncbi:GCN5 family acetyltransferase [Clavibacter tessellarius]|uniref:GCN5 family acetyltransferase n=1 Tax=Clavibacter tessellarius TaxID=31965 RepID=UPI003252D061